MAVGLVLAWGTAWASGEDFIGDAERYLKQGETRAAVIQLKNALQQEPDNRDARLLLGKVYLRLGDGPSAEKELRRAEELGVSRDEILVPLGRAYLFQGKVKKVLEAIQPAANTSAAIQAEVFALRGQAYLLQHKMDQAKSEFERGLELYPESPEARLGVARIALLKDDFDTAESTIKQVLSRTPKNVDALLLIGDLERRRKNLKASKNAFQEVINLERDNIAAYLSKAMAEIGLQEMEEAQRDIDQVRKQFPNHPLANYLQAVIDFQKKDLASAQNMLLLVLKVAPNHMPTNLMLGAIHYAEGRLEQAEELLSRYVKAVPQHIPARKLLAATYIKLRQPDKAVAVLEPALATVSDDAQLLALVGSAYMQQGNLMKGTEMLEKAVEIAPDAAAIRTQLALGHLASGKSEQAVSELESAVDLGQGLYQADMLLVLVHLRNKEFDGALATAAKLKEKMPDNPVPLNLMGVAHLGKGDTASGRSYFEQALKLKPDYAVAAMNLARLDLQENKLEQAKKRYEGILSFDSKYVGAMIGLAQLAERAGKAQEAVSWLEKARQRNPKAMEPRLFLIGIYTRAGEPLKALDVARELQETHPDNPVALRAVGTAQQAAGEHASAEVTFQKLVQAAPKSPELYYLLAEAQAKLDKLKEARANLNKALELQADYLPAKVGLVSLELRLDRKQEAMVVARRIIKEHPNLAVGHQIEGDLLMKENAYKEAVKSYEAALQKGKSAQLALNLFQARKLAGDTKLAYQALLEWLTEHPEDVPVRMVLAGAYQGTGQREEAIAHYDKVVRAQPKNVVALNNLAWLYQQQSNPKAVEYAERAYTIASDKPEIIDTLGWALVHSGKIDRGLVLLQEAVSKAPHLPEIRYHMAVALHKAGRIDEARKELKRLLRDHSDFAGVAEAAQLLERLEKK